MAELREREETSSISSLDYLAVLNEVEFYKDFLHRTKKESEGNYFLEDCLNTIERISEREDFPKDIYDSLYGIENEKEPELEEIEKVAVDENSKRLDEETVDYIKKRIKKMGKNLHHRIPHAG